MTLKSTSPYKPYDKRRETMSEADIYFEDGKKSVQDNVKSINSLQARTDDVHKIIIQANRLYQRNKSDK